MALVFLLTLLLMASAVVPCESSSLNYNAYHYDMTTPMFTPDGRLLQVEYASLAPTHSSPLLVLSVGESRILMVSAKRRGQDRLVQLSNGNVVVGLSGVLSDSVALLQKIQEDRERRFRMFGMSKSNFQHVATAIGDACQAHAFGGGIRPYGSVMVVCGLNQQTGSIELAMTDPSGAVSDLPQDEEMVLVGGTKSMQDRIRKQIKESLPRADEKQENLILQQALRTAASALLKEQRTNSKSDQSLSNSNKEEAPEDVWLEAIVLSPAHGIYRLKDRQVESLLREISQTEGV